MSNKRRRFQRRLSQRQKRMKELEGLPVPQPRRHRRQDAVQEMLDSRGGWAYQHAKRNPGHEAVEEVNSPPFCKTCGERSPLFGL